MIKSRHSDVLYDATNLITLRQTLRVTFGLFCCLLVSRLPAADFAKGADVGGLSQMEATGCKFYDVSGQPADCLAILKSYGINTIRLRVWVHPSRGKGGITDSK